MTMTTRTIAHNDKRKSLMSVQNITNEEMLSFFRLADEIDNDRSAFAQRCVGVILSLLFFEPSTRTYFSFASAMHRLGGNVLGFPQTGATSIVKGESLEDTARMMSYYSDIMAVRHPDAGAVQR